MLPDFAYYPSFVRSTGGISPIIPLPKDYKNLIKEFGDQKIRTIENFTKSVNNFVSNQSLIKSNSELIRLKWNGGLLEHIGIGTQGGLDLEETRNRAVYVPHNLGGLNGIYGAMVAINYVSELIQIRE